MPAPYRPVTEKRPVSRRLAVYFLGVAIGLMLVGLLLSTRQRMLGGQSPEQGAGETAQP